MRAWALAAGLALLASAPALAQAPAQMAAPKLPPACTDAAHRAFDFWIGRWAVTETKSGAVAGQSLIERVYDGCALRENWRETNLTGGSLNTYDGMIGKWRQTWTDSSGAWTEYIGGPEDGKMVLISRRPSKRDPSKTVLTRLTFTPNADGSVRQYSDASIDDGATWVLRYDYTYRKAKS